MKIIIIGERREGKTRFVDEVLLPSLLKQNDHGFTIYEGGIETARRPGKNPLTVHVTNDAQHAERVLKGQDK